MPWNYRIVRQEVVKVFGEIEELYAIHEAYYKTKRSKKPYSISVDSMEPHGSTLAELKNDLNMMKKALTLPVLEYSDFVETVE